MTLITSRGTQLVLALTLAICVCTCKKSTTPSKGNEGHHKSFDFDAENALSVLSDNIFFRLDKVGFNKLTAAEKTFLCIWSLEGEVNNGGFDQWFFNSSGDYVQETVIALKLIGAVKTASLVERAIAAFPGGDPPKDIMKRREKMDDIPEEVSQTWDRLDEQFYKYEEDFKILLLNYLKRNRKDIPGI